MDEYYTDRIDIITDTYDQNGVKTATDTQADVRAKFRDENKFVKNQNGEEVVSNTFVMVDKSARIAYDSRIVLKSQNGIATPEPLVERQILWIGKAVGFDFEFWRVRL